MLNWQLQPQKKLLRQCLSRTLHTDPTDLKLDHNVSKRRSDIVEAIVVIPVENPSTAALEYDGLIDVVVIGDIVLVVQFIV